MKSAKIVKIILFIIGATLVLHSRVLNELELNFNEKECYIGMGLILIALFRKIRLTIQELI